LPASTGEIIWKLSKIPAECTLCQAGQRESIDTAKLNHCSCLVAFVSFPQVDSAYRQIHDAMCRNRAYCGYFIVAAMAGGLGAALTNLQCCCWCCCCCCCLLAVADHACCLAQHLTAAAIHQT
jgi:hypothetical protein